jgi:hypothetical protein
MPADSTYREALVVAIRSRSAERSRSLLESAIEQGLVDEAGVRELLEGLVLGLIQCWRLGNE